MCTHLSVIVSCMFLFLSECTRTMKKNRVATAQGKQGVRNEICHKYVVAQGIYHQHRENLELKNELLILSKKSSFAAS